MVFPATACLIQDQVGLQNTWGFDLSAACSGFLYALTTGAQMVVAGAHRRVIVVGDSGTQMNTLCEISDPDEVAGLVGQLREEKTVAAAAFSSLFGRFNRRFGAEEEREERAEEAMVPGQEFVSASLSGDGRLRCPFAGAIVAFPLSCRGRHAGSVRQQQRAWGRVGFGQAAHPDVPRLR